MTEEQKINELLKPRYIVENEWFDCPYPNGTILVQQTHSNGFGPEMWIPGQYTFLQDDLDKYPYLVRKLSWWEERDESEMPEYYKYSGTHGIYRTQFQPNGDTIMLDFKPTETVPCKLSDCQPATSAEYTVYIEKQPTTLNQGV